MKFVVEDIAAFKKVITTITALASKKVVSTTEQCVLVEANDDGVSVTAIETGSHKATFNINASIIEKGKILILGTKLKSITSKLVPKTVVTVESNQGLLKYNVKPYGSIGESIYHDQSGFNSPLMNNSSDYIEVANNSDIIPLLLPVVSSITYSGKSIFLKTSAANFEIYSQFSETGYIKYQTPTETYQTQTCQIYLKPNLVKIIGALGKTVDIFYSKQDRAMKFTGEQGSLTIIGDSPTTNQSNTVEQILAQAVSGETVVNHTDLINSTNWQSYNVENHQAVNLSVADNSLVVQCNRNNEPAKIITEGAKDFVPITVSLAPFQLALKALGNAQSNILPITSVSLQERIIPIGDNQIKLLCLSPADDPDCCAQAVLYETRISSK